MSSIAGTVISRRGVSYKSFTWIIAVVAGVGGMLFGYDTGMIGTALMYIRPEFHLSTTGATGAWIVSATVLGAAAGAALSMYLSSRLARRQIIFVAAVVFIAGAVWCALSPAAGWLIAGRAIIGLAIGFASTIVPLYVSEVAPVKTRGSMVGIFQLTITFGILLAYAFNAALPDDWRIVFAIAVVPAVVLGIGILLLPESPRYLVEKGEIDEARSVLHKVRDPDDPATEVELGDIREVVEQDKLGFRDIFSPFVKPILFVGIGLGLFQQLTGINTIIYYLPTIVQNVGYSDNVSSDVSMVIMFLNFAVTVIALMVVDRINRRTMLLSGMVGMTASMFMLGLAYAVEAGVGVSGSGVMHFTTAWGYVTIAFAGIFIACFGVTWGWGFWVMFSEIFPLAVRGVTMSITNMFQWLANFVISLLFPILLGALGGAIVFWILAVFGVIAFVFTAKFVPETRGRSLEEMERHWRERSQRKVAAAG